MLGLTTDLSEGLCFREEVNEPFLRVTDISFGKKLDRVKATDIQTGKKHKLEYPHPRSGGDLVGFQIHNLENAQRILREEQK